MSEVDFALSDKAKEHYFVDDHVVSGFFREHRFLSNFHECKVVVDGIAYPSSEHAYMAEKTIHVEEKQLIAAFLTCKEVKKYGSSEMNITRENWEYVRVTAMMKVLIAKFTQNPELKAELLATGDRLLIETNWWNDLFWGANKGGRGLNILGECLMAVRSLLKAEV